MWPNERLGDIHVSCNTCSFISGLGLFRQCSVPYLNLFLLQYVRHYSYRGDALLNITWHWWLSFFLFKAVLSIFLFRHVLTSSPQQREGGESYVCSFFFFFWFPQVAKDEMNAALKVPCVCVLEASQMCVDFRLGGCKKVCGSLVYTHKPL